MNKELLISELTYKTSRSSGSGGQHVNKVETKVEASLDVAASDALNSREKRYLRKNVANRINKQGILQVTVEEKRSQHLNKEIATNRMVKIVEKGITPPKSRKFKPIKANKTKLKKYKQRLSEKKAWRSKVKLEDM